MLTIAPSSFVHSRTQKPTKSGPGGRIYIAVAMKVSGLCCDISINASGI